MELYNIVMSILMSTCVALCIVLCFSKLGKYKIKLPEQHKQITSISWIYIIYCVGTSSSVLAKLPEYVYNYSLVGSGISQVYLLWTFPIWALFAIMGLFYIRYYKTKLATFVNLGALVASSILAIPAASRALCLFYDIEQTLIINLFVAILIIGLSLLSIKYGWLNNISKLNMISFGLLTLSLFTCINNPVMNPIDDLFNTSISEYNNIRFLNTTVTYVSWILCCSVFTGRMLAYYCNGLSIRSYILRTILFPSLITSIWIIAVQISDFHINTAIKNTPFVSVLVLITLILFQVTSFDSISKTIGKDMNRYLKKSKGSMVTYIYLLSIIILVIFSSLIGDLVTYGYIISILILPVIFLGIINCITFIVNKVPKNELKKFLDVQSEGSNGNNSAR